jgi:hypothetical protein
MSVRERVVWMSVRERVMWASVPERVMWASVRGWVQGLRQGLTTASSTLWG